MTPHQSDVLLVTEKRMSDIKVMSVKELEDAMRRNDFAQECNKPDSLEAREARVQNRVLWAEAKRRGLSTTDCGY